MLPADRAVLLSGEKATDHTQLVWPSNLRISLPVSMFHRRIVLSMLPVSSCFPSLLTARWRMAPE